MDKHKLIELQKIIVVRIGSLIEEVEIVEPRPFLGIAAWWLGVTGYTIKKQ